MEEGGHCLVSLPPFGYNAGQEYRNEQPVSLNAIATDRREKTKTGMVENSLEINNFCGGGSLSS